MGGRVFVSGREDVLCDGVKNARVGAEERDVEDFLRVGEAEECEASIEACFFGPKVGDAETGGDLCIGLVIR